MEQIRISGKNIAAVALSDFCPRCFWIKLHCKYLPYQIFPGIFSSIDSYSKKITNYFFDRYAQLPNWFKGFGALGKPVKVPHYSKFNVLDNETNILLTGIPDDIFCKPDGSHFIVDYKTAKFTGTQDRLLPMYEVQLNSYAYIGDRVGFNPVRGLGLIYYEPFTEISSNTVESFTIDQGFSMHFSGKLLAIELNVDRLHFALNKTREIYDMPIAPERRDGCKDCQLLDELLAAIKESS